MKKIGFSLLVVFTFLFLLYLGGSQIKSFYYQPLGDPLSQEEGVNISLDSKDKQDALNIQGTCGENGTNTFIFLGTGTAGGKNSAESIRLVKVDFENKVVRVITFPRDLQVDSLDNNIGVSELGNLYQIKKLQTQGSEKHKNTEASKLVATVIQENFKISLDNYLTLGIDTWAQMIDVIGGIEVDLPSDFITSDGTVLPAGKQMLNGSQSKDYVGMIAPGTDSNRISRQDIFSSALREKVLSFEIIPKVPELIKQFDKAIYTDFSPKEINNLACMVQEVKPDSIKFYEVDNSLGDKEAIISFIKSVLDN